MVISDAHPLIGYVLDDFTIPWEQEEPDVVLLHPGLGGNSRLYRAWVPILGDTFRVLRIDPRWLDKSDGYEWSLDGFVSDVMAVLDQIGVERVHWAGASGGGIIGQHAAITKPDRIATLTLIATTARFQGPADSDYDAWLEPLDRGDHDEFLLRDAERRFGSADSPRTRWIVGELGRTPGRVSADLHRWVRNVDLVSQLKNITCPALVIAAEQDSLTGVEDAKLMAQTIPDARLEILHGYPHNFAYTNPKDVAPIVKRFLIERS